MKTTWTSMKGVCLLLLGMATTFGGRSFAADISLTNFSAFAESSSAATAGTAIANPFKDESVGTAAKAVPAEPGVAEASPSPYAAGLACTSDDFVGAPGRFWFSAEYIHWWTTGAYLPPLVSTVTNLNDPNNLNSLQTVFGNRDVYNGNHDGYRMDFGMWLDCRHCWGLEADYFDISGKPANYDSGLSNGYANGNLFPIVRPYFDPGPTGGPVTGIQLSGVGYPLNWVGRVTVDTSNYFQSAGAWFRRPLRASEWTTNNSDVNWTNPAARTFRLDGIAGYRFARLIDTVDEQDSEMEINSAASDYLTQYSFIDSYRSVNTFNGAELGFNTVYTFGRWSLDVVGKAALGFNNQYVRLHGFEQSDASNTTPPGGTPIFQSSTTQEYTRDRFSAIPELTVTGGYQVTDHLKFTVGYDLLYWSAVVRAANQIAVEQTTGIPYGTLVGNPLPPFAFNEGYFRAQGLRLGGEFRF